MSNIRKNRNKFEVKSDDDDDNDGGGGGFDNNALDLSDEIIMSLKQHKSINNNKSDPSTINITVLNDDNSNKNQQNLNQFMSKRLSTSSLPEKIDDITTTNLVDRLRSSMSKYSSYSSWISSSSTSSSSSSSSTDSETLKTNLQQSSFSRLLSNNDKHNDTNDTSLTINTTNNLNIFVDSKHNNNNNNNNFFYDPKFDSNEDHQQQQELQQPVLKKQNKYIEISRNVYEIDQLYKIAGQKYSNNDVEEDGEQPDSEKEQENFLGKFTKIIERGKKRKRNNTHHCSIFSSCIKSYIPILDWLPRYPIKSYLIPDIIAGITISILHTPQGIAYSMLAGLEPVHGLYVSFFPVLIYTLLGTSPYISVGTFAIASIMLNNIATKMGAFNNPGTIINHTAVESWNESSTTILPTDSIISSTMANTSYSNNNPTPLEVLTSVGLLCGFIQITMSLLRLGSLSLILSEQLVSAFSTAVAFHVATSQLSSIFGYTNLQLGKSGPFKLIKTWIILSKHLDDVNIYCLIFSTISIIILIISKELLEPRFKKFSSFPLPIDLILVITSIIISWLLKFNHEFDIQVVKNVPTGLPKPTVPRFDLMPNIFIDSVVLSLVCFAVSLSLAKIFAKKHGQQVRPNQELLALGCANFFSSFFLAYPCSAALSRSTLQEKVGGKTQIAGIVSSAIILTILLFLAPFLYHLPKFTLSCIVLVALKSMFLQISDVRVFWRISKLDGTAWIITFLSVIILDIDYGLIIGIFAAILVILIKLAFPKTSVLGHVQSTEIYIENEYFNNLNEYPGLKVFRFSSPLFYLNIDSFKERIMKIYTETFESSIEPKKALILDLSGMSFIDKTGIDVLVDTIKMLQSKQIHTFLTQCPYHIIQSLKMSNFFQKVDHSKIICKLFPTNHDAVISFF